MTLEEYLLNHQGPAGSNLWAKPEVVGVTSDSEVKVLKNGANPGDRSWINLGDAGYIASVVSGLGYFGPSIVLDQLTTRRR
jgi:hypothetical protein